METKNTSQVKKDAVAGIFGNILEWYDFAVFGFLAPILSLLFFPQESKIVGIIMAYGIFATGYMMRPLGGVVFGYIGDKKGRKIALNISIFLMAIPTLLMGFLPTFEDIGITATVLLLILRMLQGLAVGGELIGSVSYLVEIAPKDRKGLYGSFTLFSAVGGLLLGSSIVTLLSTFLDSKAMLSWGWRLPFIMGIIIFAVGLSLRKDMSESPEFSYTIAQKSSPIREIIQTMPMRVVELFLIVTIATSSSYMLLVWMPTYLGEILPHPISYALALNTLSLVIVLFTIPFAGKLSDKYGKKELMMFSSLAIGLLSYPLFLLTKSENIIMLIVAQFIFAILSGFIQGPLPALMVEMFPSKLRYTGTGLGYNIATALIGGTTPMVATMLIHQTGNLTSPAIYLIAFSIISFVTLYRLKI
jgi:MHS family proline/betaine transporter-like MFS transporter